MYAFLADVTLTLHACYIGFVLFGLLLTLAGGLCGWTWIRNIWFRVLHGAAIVIVVAQAWLGIECPLTTAENALRLAAGEAAIEISFIQHWLHRLIFFHAPPWVFTLSYSAFGALVLVTWIWVPPRALKNRSDSPQ